MEVWLQAWAHLPVGDVDEFLLVRNFGGGEVSGLQHAPPGTEEAVAQTTAADAVLQQLLEGVRRDENPLQKNTGAEGERAVSTQSGRAASLGAAAREVSSQAGGEEASLQEASSLLGLPPQRIQ